MRLRTLLATITLLLLLTPSLAPAQNSRTELERIARAMGATNLRSIEITGSGLNYAVGQSAVPGAPWPRFNVKSFTRAVDYQAGALRDEYVRTQGEEPPRGGGPQPIRGEQRQLFLMSGDYAWNVVNDAPVPVPITLAERRFQLWTSPHGVIKAALANKGTVKDRVITFSIPGHMNVRATVDHKRLVEHVQATIPSAVLGDLPIEIRYSEYRDFGGVKFPTKIEQSASGFPSLDVTISGVRPNAPLDVPVPEGVRQATSPYARVTSEKVADGVWYVTGGTHHSAVVEMNDHLVVVEAPLNDERALAVLAEVRGLSPKPIKYVINSHHHFDHAGGLRAVAGEGITILTHEVNRPFFARVLGTPASVSPDHLTKSGKKGAVEGVRERHVLSDGTREMEIHRIAGNAHHDGLLMVYLPKERLLIQADAFTPGPANAPPPTPANPFSVNLADNITRLGLNVDQLLPLHGRIVPLAELHRAIGR
jgi:glyoxylase-like metal-dependent hydrolase (beta-lactamase superfamily II)